MPDTNEMTRDQQLLEEFKAGLEKDGPIVLAQRVAALEEERDQASGAVTAIEAERDAASERIVALEAERDAALARADAAEAAGRKAIAKVKKVDAPSSPRKLGPLPEGKRLADDDLVAAIGGADRVEIAFSDGKRELAGMAPIGVSGEAWKRHAFGVMLGEPVHLEGPQEASTRIAGYALLLDGKQVAWCQRSSPLPIAPGQRVTIVDDILF